MIAICTYLGFIAVKKPLAKGIEEAQKDENGQNEKVAKEFQAKGIKNPNIKTGWGKLKS